MLSYSQMQTLFLGNLNASIRQQQRQSVNSRGNLIAAHLLGSSGLNGQLMAIFGREDSNYKSESSTVDMRCSRQTRLDSTMCWYILRKLGWIAFAEEMWKVGKLKRSVHLVEADKSRYSSVNLFLKLKCRMNSKSGNKPWPLLSLCDARLESNKGFAFKRILSTPMDLLSLQLSDGYPNLIKRRFLAMTMPGLTTLWFIAYLLLSAAQDSTGH